MSSRISALKSVFVLAACSTSLMLFIFSWHASENVERVLKAFSDQVRSDEILQRVQDFTRTENNITESASPAELDIRQQSRDDMEDFTDSNNLHEAYDHVTTILLFVGYSRSRHSLVSSLLDAHPHVIIADESYALTSWMSRPKLRTASKYDFFDTLRGSSVTASKKGRRSRPLEGTAADPKKFGYDIPGQWQASYDRYIQVMGDKTAWDTSSTLLRRGTSGVEEMKEKLGVKVKFLHVIRNPFDNIATFVLRHREITARKSDHQIKINASKILDEKIDRYFNWAKGSNVAEVAYADDTLDVFSMDVVRKPAETLRKMCDFLEISCSEDYIRDCAAIVDPVPSITRHHIVWSEEQKNRVYTMMKQYRFFDRFSFEED